MMWEPRLAGLRDAREGVLRQFSGVFRIRD